MAHCAVPEIPLSERRTFTMGEVAALLGMSVATLYAERARGRLRTIRLAGRRLITREALDAYVATARRDTSRSNTRPETEPPRENEQQSRPASAIPPTAPRQVNRGNHPKEKSRPPADGDRPSISLSPLKEEHQRDDTY
jgi:excisionase family DNA binding protein